MTQQTQFDLLEPGMRRKILRAQTWELTEFRIYSALARHIRDPHNRELVVKIAEQERSHHDFWQAYTGRAVKAPPLLVAFYGFVARVFGTVFGMRLAERRERLAQISYSEIETVVPSAARIREEEELHEQELIDLLQDKTLEYVGSIVLGLNDALVELTGALAGLSFAIKNPSLIAATGLITGVAASLSMAASEFLSKRAEGGPNAARSAVYTGITYILTVALLILPYILLSDPLVSLAVTLAIATCIILAFNFYLAVAKNLNFHARFWEMFGISMGVAVISFGVGILVREVFGLEL